MNSKTNTEAIYREAQTLRRLRHPNIVRCFIYHKFKSSIFIGIGQSSLIEIFVAPSLAMITVGSIRVESLVSRKSSRILSGRIIGRFDCKASKYSEIFQRSGIHNNAPILNSYLFSEIANFRKKCLVCKNGQFNSPSGWLNCRDLTAPREQSHL